MLGRVPGDAGEVGGEVVVCCGDRVGVGVEVAQAQRGALELDGRCGMLPGVFQLSAGAIDQGELGEVTSGIEDFLAVAQEAVSIG